MGARRSSWGRWLAAAPLWCALAWLLHGPTAAAIELTEIARLDISATGSSFPAQTQHIGSYASAVAWKSGKLFVAGYNWGATQDVGIVQVLGATTPGVTASPGFGTAFSRIRTGGARGFSGLALSDDGSQLAAAFYGGLSASPDGLQLYSLLGGLPSGGDLTAKLWNLSLAGGSGVAFDPGYDDGLSIDGRGVAWVNSAWSTQSGANRRMLREPNTGLDVWTAADGMTWHPEDISGIYRNARDIAFDPTTGDLFARLGNDLAVARRTGGNSVLQGELLYDAPDAETVDNQHLAWLSTPADGGMLIFNDRPWNATTQPGPQDFANVVRMVSVAGAPMTPTFNFLDGYQPAAGDGWYDFDFDPATQTLAMLDSSNRQVHIFQVGGAAGVLADGDFDEDGDVDGADFLTWQRHVGVDDGAATHAQGDANSDQLVDGADLAAWRGQFGVTGAISAQSIPEPAAGVLAGLAVAGCAASRRRKRAAR